MRSRPGGKGSARRPTLIETQEADARWDAIFGKKKTEVPDDRCKNNCPGCTCKNKTDNNVNVGGVIIE